jgi:hypothetical protein
METLDVKTIKIQPLPFKQINIRIVGITPLLMNKPSDETLRLLAEGATKTRGQKSKIRDLEKEAKEKIHLNEKGETSYPSSGFLGAIVEAAPYVEGLNKKLLKGALIFEEKLIPIKFSKQDILKGWSKAGSIGSAITPNWRPQFHDWSCVLSFSFNEKQISLDQIANAIQIAGMQIGIGSWSPQHSGTYGRFRFE